MAPWFSRFGTATRGVALPMPTTRSHSASTVADGPRGLGAGGQWVQMRRGLRALVVWRLCVGQRQTASGASTACVPQRGSTAARRTASTVRSSRLWISATAALS